MVPGLAASSSPTTPSSTSPSSSSQDSVFDVNRYTENQVPERSGSTNEELRGDPLHESTDTENKKKMENAKKYKEMYRANWLIGYRSSKKFWSMKIVLEKHFKENLVDESTSKEPWVKPRAGKPRHVHVIS